MEEENKNLSEKSNDQLAKIINDFLKFIEPHSQKIENYLNNELIFRSCKMILDFILLIMMCSTLGCLTYYDKLNGETVAGLFGAMIGYAFGGVYKNKKD